MFWKHNFNHLLPKNATFCHSWRWWHFCTVCIVNLLCLPAFSCEQQPLDTDITEQIIEVCDKTVQAISGLSECSVKGVVLYTQIYFQYFFLLKISFSIWIRSTNMKIIVDRKKIALNLFWGNVLIWFLGALVFTFFIM